MKKLSLLIITVGTLASCQKETLTDVSNESQLSDPTSVGRIKNNNFVIKAVTPQVVSYVWNGKAMEVQYDLTTHVKVTEGNQISEFRFYDGTDFQGSSKVDADGFGTYTFRPSKLPGTYTVRVIAFDKHGRPLKEVSESYTISLPENG
jgi:hypothetical protein